MIDVTWPWFGRRSYLCHLCVLCASVVDQRGKDSPQRPESSRRGHREELSSVHGLPATALVGFTNCIEDELSPISIFKRCCSLDRRAAGSERSDDLGCERREPAGPTAFTHTGRD